MAGRLNYKVIEEMHCPCERCKQLINSPLVIEPHSLLKIKYEGGAYTEYCCQLCGTEYEFTAADIFLLNPPLPAGQFEYASCA